MEKKLKQSQLEYAEVLSELKLVEEEADKYQKEFNAIKREKDILEKSIEESLIKKERANKLVGLLKDEEIRWTNSVAELDIESKNILGNILLSTGIVSYLGPLTEVYRLELKQKWTEMIKNYGVSISDRFNFIEILGDRILIREWNNASLPTDDISSENAIIAMNGFNWPMMIDPQKQANRWLKNILQTKKEEYGQKKEDSRDDDSVSRQSFGYGHEQVDPDLTEPGLKILNFGMPEKKFAAVMKLAISNGYPVIIEDVHETLPPILEPVVSKQIKFSEIDVDTIKFNDEDIPYNEFFKLYFTTKISNPKFLPNIFIKTTVINFTVTIKGLEDQLLGDVVMIEDPELELKKNDNLEKLSYFRKVLVQQEKKILKLLWETDKSPVDDPELIESLDESKKLSMEIQMKFEQSEISNKEITQTRENFRGVATRGSIIYFVIDDISKIDPMYQYSLQYIKKLFVTAIESTPKEQGEEGIRNKKLLESITKVIYTNVSRGLFEQHKFIFSLLIWVSVKLKDKSLNSQLWNILLRGTPAFEKTNQPEIPDPSYLSQYSWDIAYYLDLNFPQFAGLCLDVKSNFDRYKNWANDQEPFLLPIPDKWKMAKMDLREFDKILLIKILRQEKLIYSLTKYVEHYMGSYYVGSLSVQMEDIYTDSDCKTPIIFVLSQGADPKSLIEKFGAEKGFLLNEGLIPISLGQGQGVKADQIIRRSIKEGLWALLENCHLSKSWMPELEKLVELIQSDGFDDMNPNFRLFLTSMP